MKILTSYKHKKVVLEQRVKEENDIYKRTLYDDDSVVWEPVSYDGEQEDETGDLEKKYQKLINKSVTTTNEQPKLESPAILIRKAFYIQEQINMSDPNRTYSDEWELIDLTTEQLKQMVESSRPRDI